MKPIKKLFTSISMFSFLSVACIPMFSCSTTTKSKDNQNSDDLNLNESENENGKGILDDKISQSLFNISKLEYTEINSNIFDFDMYKQDFIKNFNPFADIQKYPNINKDYFKVDVYTMLNNIYKSSDSKIDLNINKQEINYDSTNNSIFIDFELSISNPYKLARSFIVANKEFFITPYSTKIIKIIVPMQKMKYNINYDSLTKRNYIQWICETVNITVDENNFELKDFSFNKVNSYAIPYYVKNIFVENQNYINEEKFDLNKLTFDQVKNDISTHFLTTKENVIKYIGFIHPILQEVVKNQSIDKTVEALAPTMSKILVESKMIDESLTQFIIDLLSNKKGILTIFDEQRDAITNFIGQFLINSSIPLDSIKEIMNQISPTMSNETKQMFFGLIQSDFVPEKYQVVLKGIVEVLFNDAKLFDVIDVIFNQLNDQIQGVLPQTEFIKSIFNFLKIVFTKNASGEYSNTLDLLLNNKTTISSLLNTILPLLGMSGNEKMIDQIYTNNPNFNIKTLTNLLNTSIIPFAGFIAEKSNYEIQSGYVKENNLDVFTYEKNTNQVTYKYDLKFVFKKEFRLELQPFYNILPSNMDMNGTNIPISVIMGVDVLPYFFTFGINDSLDLLFTANNDYLYLTPISQSDYYIFNYTIPYTVNFKLNMPSGFDTMFREYDEKVFGASWGLDTIPWGFIKSFAYSFLFPSYTLSGSLNTTYDNWLNYNYLPSLPSLDLTFKWNDLTQDQLNSLSTFIESRDSNTYIVHSKRGDAKTIVGKKPYLIDGKRKELENMLFTLGDGFKSLPSNQQPIISINPTIDGKIVYSGSIGAGVEIKLIDVSIYFPNPRIIDLANSNMESGKFIYQNVYKKTLSF